MKKICSLVTLTAMLLCAGNVTAQKPERIYSKVEEEARYPAAKRAVMLSLIFSNLCMPESNEKDGNVSEITVLSPAEFNSAEISQRLLKAYQSLPWTFSPGKFGDTAVRSLHREFLSVKVEDPGSIKKCSSRPPLVIYTDEFQNMMDTRTLGFRNYTTNPVTLYLKYIDPKTQQSKTDKITLKAGKATKEKDDETNKYIVKPEEIIVSYSNKTPMLFNYHYIDNGKHHFSYGDSEEEVYISESGITVKYIYAFKGYVAIYERSIKEYF